MRVERIHFKFHVIMRRSARVNKNFEIIIVIHDTVALFYRCPDFIAFQQGSNIEVPLVPADFCSGAETRRRKVTAADINKILGKRHIIPERFINISVKHQFARRFRAKVYRRLRRKARHRYGSFKHGLILRAALNRLKKRTRIPFAKAEMFLIFLTEFYHLSAYVSTAPKLPASQCSQRASCSESKKEPRGKKF